MTKQFLRTFGPFAITNYRLGKQDYTALVARARKGI